MTNFLLPPDTPLVGRAPMSPAWYRWFRDFVIDAQSTSALNDGQAITGQALVVGDNTIPHTLGRVPSGWFPTKFFGAFPVVTGKAGVYQPPPGPQNVTEKRYFSATSSSSTFSLRAAPADGSVLLLSFYTTESTSVTYPGITSITQTGVTWTKINSDVFNPSRYNAIEMWIGTDIASASASLTVTFGASHAFDLRYYSVAEFQSGLTGTVVASDAGNVDPSTTVPIDLNDALTPPESDAGEVCFAAVAFREYEAYIGTASWPAVAGVGGSSGSNLGTLTTFMHIPQRTDNHPLRMSGATAGEYCGVYAVLGASLDQVGGSSDVTVPHGLRQVSISDSSIVINSVSAVEVDLWVF